MRVEPRATYRVQLGPDLDFDDAAAIVPYLAALGATHLYCSPYMESALGSRHGYDVVDPTRVRAELGGEPGLRRLDAALSQHGMGQLLDIVPNHLHVDDPHNARWWDVLRRGRDSEHASFFDIDWEAPGLEGRVLLPVLGDTLDAVLQRGELRIVPAGADAGLSVREPVLAYFEHRFPLAPDSATNFTAGVSRELLARQHYVLEHWRRGMTWINYRRFFDITSLAAVRSEREEVHLATHARALQLVASGVVDGVRVDHVDGLHDPGAYTSTLRSETGGAWVVVEKILGDEERIPGTWPVDGTTGYDVMARLTALHVDARGREPLQKLYVDFTGDDRPFAEHARDGRLVALQTLLSSELDRVARCAAAAGISNAHSELVQLLAAMPRYRLYARGWAPLCAADSAALESAVRRARPHCRPGTLTAILRVLRAEGEPSDARLEMRARFQQLSSAVTAKGVEDTAFYRHVPLVALNEVGNDPSCFGISTAAFHQACAVAADSPRSLVATATHDTKHGEDARVRVAMLSEMSRAWADAVRRWHELAERHAGRRAPSRTAEYLFFQTMIAAHPISVERCSAYMRKAAREAKQETSWLDVDAEYEAELDAFVTAMLGDVDFVASVATFVRSMTPAWQVASLSQTLLKCFVPGVADVYQGSELWDLSLVDPDNRRAVDYARRRTLLAELDRSDAATSLVRSATGLPKLHVLRHALRVRAGRPGNFGPGSGYGWLDATGQKAAHAVVSMRSAPGSGPGVIAVTVRQAYTLDGRWGDTVVSLPVGEWRNVLTDERVNSGVNSLATLLRTFPVALLERVL